MDIVQLPGSRILDIAKIAFATPGVDFLCFGESDQPSPRAAHDAAVASLDAGETRYADVRGLPPLRAALADYLTGLHARPVSETRIQVTASGMSAMAVALSCVVRSGERVLLHEPAWPNVGNAARLRGAEVRVLDLTALADGRFSMDFERLDAMLAGTRAFVLNSPNNPTGWTATRDELTTILTLCRKHGTWLLADEVYSRLVYDGSEKAPSVLDIAEPSDRVMVANSFSKAWVMTGWRLGWLVVPEGARDAVTEVVEVVHSGVAAFVQAAGLAALSDTETVARFRAHCARGCALVSAAMTGMNGVRYAAPVGAFYAFLGVDGLTDSLRLAKTLVTEHGVAVAPGIAFGKSGEGHLRLCFAQSPDLVERAMGRLSEGLRAQRVIT